MTQKRDILNRGIRIFFGKAQFFVLKKLTKIHTFLNGTCYIVQAKIKKKGTRLNILYKILKIALENFLQLLGFFPNCKF